MAMLAEPKRKQKFSFDPRNTNWSNDESKFGHKLMEKMGWSKGKGLGANEDGKTENISVSVKNDTRGVGCSKSYVDNWIAHQDDFNALLSDLQQDHSKGDSKQEDESTKVISLEQKSRTSKGRLHYQKFTKGKDLSLKSETDLDCVFGKRKSQSGTDTPQPQSESSSDNESFSHGFNTVTSTDSVQDYFKRKMAERLKKLSGVVDDAEENDNANTNISGDTKSKGEDETVNVLSNAVDIEQVKMKEKKKSKKRKASCMENDDNVESIGDCTEETKLGEIVDNAEVKKKKKKSKKKKQKDIDMCNEDSVTELKKDIQNETIEKTEDVKVSKKKSKKKNRNSDTESRKENDAEPNKVDEINCNKQTVENKDVCESIQKKKKDKKRKTGDLVSQDVKIKKRVTFVIGDEDDGCNETILEDVKSQKNSVEERNEEEREDKKKGNIVEKSESLKKCKSSASKANENSECEVKDKILAHEPQMVSTSSAELAYNERISCKTFEKYNSSHSLKFDLKSVPEVKKINQSFRGANMTHVNGYAGLKVTSVDVMRKLHNKDVKYSRNGKKMIRRQQESKTFQRWFTR